MQGGLLASAELQDKKKQKEREKDTHRKSECEERKMEAKPAG